MPTETRRESMGVLESIWCPSTFLLTQGLGSAPPLHPPWVGDQLASPGLRDCRGSRPLGWVASWRDTGGVDTAPPSPSALLWAPPKLLLTLVTFPRGTSVGGGMLLGQTSKGLLPLCWPKDPCSQKPGQTPQARCVVGVPAPEGRGGVGKGGKVWRGCALGAWHGAPVGSLPLSPPKRVSGHLSFSLGLHNPYTDLSRSSKPT